MRRGIVMSGGGARGAYEVGVLNYLYGEFARHFGRVPKFDVISGTSVGAINGTALAATANDPVTGMRLLEGVWVDERLSDIMRVDLRHLPRLYRVLLGGSAPSGIFDSRPLGTLIGQRIPWRQLARNLRAGHLRALTVSATNVRTGRSMLYVDRGKNVPLPRGSMRIAVQPAHILPHHVLASAAMPIVFAPVRIGNEFFCDGGIRLNTPTAPSIQLGADRLFVIGVSTPASESAVTRGATPGAAYLLGKAVDALMLDHIEHDLEQLRLVNEILSDAIMAGGPGFEDKLNAVAAEQGRPARRLVQSFVLHPSVDIGMIASQHLSSQRPRLSRLFGHTALRMLDVGEGADADLASYVLFDGDFARTLVELGRSDAARYRDELAEFLFSDRDSQ